jgi:exodeoxyribonuclease V gamma subunit
MLRILHSNALEELASALVRNLEARDPLEPIEIAVFSRTLAAHLKIAIAHRAGIAANLRFQTLHGFLAQRCDPSKLTVADTRALQAEIISVLLDPRALEEMDPVRSYLFSAGDDEDHVDLRRVQLSAELADLFESYAFTRADRVRAWPDQHWPGVDPTIERWERALWLRLFGPRGPLDPRGARVMLADALLFAPHDRLTLPSVAHVFVPSSLTEVHQAIFARLGERMTLHLYALNPCREFWDDVDAPGENAPLRCFARAARTSLRLLGELNSYDIEPAFTEPRAEASTLLADLKDAILVRAPERSRRRIRDDESVQFVQCASVRREIEAVAAEIWSLVETWSPPLFFHEIAVVLAGKDSAAHRAHVGAVFAEMYEIPHHEIDAPIGSASRVVEALDLLLALPHSEWTRTDLLRLILHPLVTDPSAAEGEWARWLDALNVLHGADHRDHAPTYIEKDLYNWDQGLRRIALGAFMSGDASGDSRAMCVDGNDYLPLEISADRLESASRLLALVRSLIADARFMRREKMRLSEWAEMFAELLASYVHRETEQDEHDMMRVLGAIHRLKEIDPGAEFSFRIASELLRRSLARLGQNRGQPLADGVCVASLEEIAPLPFRVVFMVGLGEGSFPTHRVRSQLDLRTPSPRANDISLRDVEEHRFLERILATSDRIYFSWISRDARTGDRLEPSPAILELREILARDFGSDLDRLTRTPPLRRYDPRRLDAKERITSPAADREIDAAGLRASLLAAVQSQSARLDLPLIRRTLAVDRRRALERRLGLIAPPDDPPASEEPRTISVPYSALRAFLEDPREGWKRFVLGMRDDDDEDPLAREIETLSSSALDATVLLREVLAEDLRRRKRGDALSIESIYDARAERLELLGTLPTGVFARSERHKHLAILEAWRSQLARIFGERLLLGEQIRFGRAREHTEVEVLLDPLVVQIERPRVRVELSGRTELMLDPPCSVIAMAKEEADAREHERLTLRGFFDHLALCALDRSSGSEHRSLILFAGTELHQVRFLPFSRAEAIDYMRVLLEDLLSGPHDFELPLAEALESRGEAIVERRFGPYLARKREELR